MKLQITIGRQRDIVYGSVVRSDTYGLTADIVAETAHNELAPDAECPLDEYCTDAAIFKEIFAAVDDKVKEINARISAARQQGRQQKESD